jgi:gamma-glutamyltranspeptidase
VRGETESDERVIYPERMNLEMTPERGWSVAIADALKSAGFEVVSVDRHASFGRVHLVAKLADAWQGVADPDWEGTAAGPPRNCSRSGGRAW